MALWEDPMQTFIDVLPLAREKSGPLQAIEETATASTNACHLTPSVKSSANLYT
jgi:hypothetical protein